MGRHSISGDASGQTWEPRQPREGRVGRRSLAARMQDNSDGNTGIPSPTSPKDAGETPEETTHVNVFDTFTPAEQSKTSPSKVPSPYEEAGPQPSLQTRSQALQKDAPLPFAVDSVVGRQGDVNPRQSAMETSRTTQDSPDKMPSKKKPSLFIRMIGVLGEIFITLGVMIGLFIVWQVWWTDILAGREQDQRLQEVTQTWQPPATGIGTKRYDEPPVIDHNTTIGSYEGVMRIPAFGTDYKHTIEYGVNLEEVLDKGAYGHYDETAWPGEVGNFALAAHRQTYGAPMKNVDKLTAGSPIIVETKDAYLVYYVTESYITVPSDSDVIAPVPNRPEIAPTERLLTITTCHPPFVSNERWIIHAKLDHWVARSDGIPEELAEEK